MNEDPLARSASHLPEKRNPCIRAAALSAMALALAHLLHEMCNAKVVVVPRDIANLLSGLLMNESGLSADAVAADLLVYRWS